MDRAAAARLHGKVVSIADEILARCIPIPECGCLVFEGAWTSDQYGSVRRDGSSRQAHRMVWEDLHGPLPPGVDLDHLCRVHPCCNDAHLEPVPHRVNVTRGVSIMAQNARRTHCPQGHAYTEANSYKRKSRPIERDCRTCRRIRARRRKDQERAKRKM